MHVTKVRSISAIDRRVFLRKAFIGGLAVAVTACRQLPLRRARAPALHLALLADTHVPADRSETYRSFKPWDNLQQIVQEILAKAPSGIVICGDAARLEGKTEDYKQLRSILSPFINRVAVHIALGNHDDRTNFMAVFSDIPSPRAPVYSRYVTILEHSAARLVFLDSLLYTNKTPGYLGRDQRNWLDRFLSLCHDRPVAIFVHHTLGDGDGELLDADRLFGIVHQHRCVKAIFYGHSHEWHVTRKEGLALVNLPAVGYNFKDADPVGWVEACFHPSGVHLQLHPLKGGAKWESETVFVPWT